MNQQEHKTDLKAYQLKDPNKEEISQIINIIIEGIQGDVNHEPDTVWKWRLGENYSQELKLELLQYYSNFYYHLAYQFGQILVIKDQKDQQIAGSAFITPPGIIENGQIINQNRLNQIIKLMNGQKSPLIENPQKLGQDVINRFDIFKELLINIHQKYEKPHWYMFLLVIKPQYQNKGYGSSLINKFNNLAEKDNTFSYLECAGERRKQLYEKYGYKVVEQKDLIYQNQIGKDKLYVMIRNYK